MLVKASLISAMLLSLIAEASAQERVQNPLSDKQTGPKPPEAGQKRALTAEDLFPIQSLAPSSPANQRPGAAAPDKTVDPSAQVIRSRGQRVDESGLRYFASQNNQKRVEKEIQRLKALYPDWTPPDDLFYGAPGGPEEQPFWDLFAQDKTQEMRAAIADKMKAEPKWKPSQALMYKLERKESRIKLVTAFDSRQWRKVIEVAAADPKILTCTDIDVQWRVAEAFASIGQKPQTFDVYRFILANCKDKKDRLTTLKKSLAYFEPREIDVLVAMGARNADGTQEFDDIRVDLSRIRLGKIAAGTTAERISPEDLAFFENRTKAEKASADASLIGWFRLKQNESDIAVNWFAQALEWPLQLRDDGTVMQEQAKMAEGHILALKSLGRFDEAEKLAADWAPKSDTVRLLFLDILGDALLRAAPTVSFEQARLDRYELIVASSESKFGAQALGWYYFNRINWTSAIPWFQSSLAWADVERAPPVPPGAAATTPEPAPAKAASTAKPADSAARNPAKAGPADAKSNRTTATDQKPAVAPAATDQSLPLTSDAKTAEGLVVALRNAYRFDEAEDVSYTLRDLSPALRAFYIDVFAESLVRQSAPLHFSGDRLTRYAAIVEQDHAVVGAQGLAWYFHNRALWPNAIKWFRNAIEWSPSRGDAKMAEGYSQSLRRDGQFGVASDVAYDWRDTSPVLRSLFFDISGEQLSTMPPAESLAKDKMNRFGGMVTLDRSSQGAGALAWYLYDRKTYAESVDWFRNGLEYKPDNETRDRMREGFVLSLRYVGRTEEAEDRAFEWRESSKRLSDAYFEIAAEAVTRLPNTAIFPSPRMMRLVDATNAAKSAFGAQAIGWYFQKRGENAVAADWFGQALTWGDPGTDPKTAQGYLLTLVALGRMDEADQLAFTWHTKSDEFRTLYIDTFGGAILRTTPPQAFPEGMLRHYEQIAGYDRSVFGAQALGWYQHDRQDWAEAARWFESSLGWATDKPQDAKTVEGFAQALRHLARREDAEDILYAWRDKAPILRKLYAETVVEALTQTTAEVAISDERLNRFAEVALLDKDAFAAQGLAWYRHDRRQWADAVRWFKYAREWSEDARKDAKIAEGLAASLRGLDLFDESENLLADWKDTSPTLRRLYIATAGELLVRLKPEQIYPDDRMQRFLETVSRDADNGGAQSAGWYYYNRDMFQPAAEWLHAALSWGPDAKRDTKTAEGYVEALRRLGRIADAELAAWDWITRSDAFKRVYVNLAAEVIAGIKPPATFPAERLAKLAELSTEFSSTTGAVGLAWYHQARSEWREAAWWFERSLEWGGKIADVKAAEGYVVALIGLGRYEEAEGLVFSWRGRSERISGLYLDVFGGALLRLPKEQVISEERLARFMFLVGEEKSVWGSQAAGWYFYDRANWNEAARWFETSLSWTANGAYEAKTVEGFAQSIRYFARRDEAENQLYPWRDKIPVMRKLYIELVAEAMVSTSAPIFLSDERINRYADVVLADKDWFGAQGLAWYRHDRRHWPDAVRWFKYAREWHVDGDGVTGRGDAKMAEGLAFSLRNLDLYDESEAVSVAWKDHAPALRKLYAETVGEYLVRLKPESTYPNDRMQRFLETVSADSNNVSAQAAGWYYYARDMFTPAADWFSASLQWGPDIVRDPKTAEGYVTALRRADRLSEAEAAAFELRERSPALRELYFAIAGEVIAAMKPPAEFEADRLARFIEMTQETRSVPGALAIAWYRQAREQWQESAQWFEQAATWNNGDPNDPKVSEGYLVALIGLGRYDEAENLVHYWRQRNPDIARLYVDVFGGSLLKLAATQVISAERLDRFSVIVGLEQSEFGAQSLAWYHFDRRNWDDAVRWFQASLGWATPGRQDVKSIEGFAQALRNTGRRDEAEDLFFLWRGHSAGMNKLYIETVSDAMLQQSPPIDMSDRRIDRFAAVVLNERSASGAQSLGWYRYNRKSWGDAVRWFKSARAWSTDGKGDAKLAEGLAFALRNMDLYDESETVSWEWRDRAPAMRKLYVETVAEFIVRLKENETYPLDRMSRYQVILTADRSSIGAQAAGWYYFGRNSFADAAKWFRNALDWGPDIVRDPKTAEGLMIALRNAGRYDDAEMLAFDWRLKSPRFAQLYAEIAAEAMGRLTGNQAYPSDRLARLASYARDQRNAFAAQSIGWYRAGRSEWAEAAEWFKLALDFTGDEKDPKTIEGYALALHNLGRIDEAEALAFAWKDKGDAFATLYLDTVIGQLTKLAASETYPADRLASFAKLVNERRHIAGAQTLGWYRLARNENADGESWFKNAMDWAGNTRDEKLVEGYANALKRQMKYAEAEALAYDGRASSDAMREIYRTTMIEQMVKTKAPAAIAPERLKRFAEFATQHRQAESARALGWYAYDRKDWPVALAWFKSASEWETDTKNTKGTEGYLLTLKNMGKIEEAEAYAYDNRDRSDEMRSLYIDLVPEMLAKLDSTKTFPADRLNRFATQVTAAKSPYGAQSLAWYRHMRNDHAQALVWFKSAMDWSGEAKDPKTAEGYVLNLRATGQNDQAEAIAYEWRDRADTLRAQFVEVFAEALTRSNPPPAFAPERLARYVAVVSADKNAAGAQALGWYSYNIKQLRPARAWFEKAMQWGPSEGSALGMALSAKAMKDNASYANIIALYRTTFPKLMELLNPQTSNRAAAQIFATTQIPVTVSEPQTSVVEEVRTVRAPRGRRAAPARTVSRESSSISTTDSANCIARVEAKQRAGTATSGDMVAKGWCLLNANRPQEAAAAFERGRNAKGDDPAYGQALSMLRSGETDAAASAGERLQSAKKRNDVGVQVLQQRAIAAQRAGRHVEVLHYLDQRAAFANEGRDGTMMRGWALWNLGRKDAARRIFTELDRQLSTNDTQSALGVVNEVRGN